MELNKYVMTKADDPLACCLTLGTIWAMHAQEAVLRITQEEALRAARITKPQPTYPPMARQLKIQGRVEVEDHP